ncbi:MAG: hypothetical protein V4439_04380 [Patescibacteria group bacterium]
MKKPNNIIFQIFLAVFFIAIALGAFFYIFNNLNAKNADLILLNQQTQDEYNSRAKISALNSEAKAIKDERDLLAGHFADSSDPVPFLDTLQALAKKAGANAEFSSVDLSKDGTGLEVQIKAEGSFISLHKLIALLENSPYEFDFSFLDLQKKVLSDAEAKLSRGTIWSMNLKVTLISFLNK